jgi:hypothetical protein
MAKYKPVRPGAKKAGPATNYRGMISCLVFIVLGFALFFVLFYAMLKSS